MKKIIATLAFFNLTIATITLPQLGNTNERIHYSNNPILLYGNDSQNSADIKKVFKAFDIACQEIKSLDITNDSHVHLIFNIGDIPAQSLPKYYIAYNTCLLESTSLAPDQLNKFSNAVAVWDAHWQNINAYRSSVHNFYYLPEKYEYADPVILSCRLPVETLAAYKEILCYSNTRLSDIASHLPTIFAHTVLQKPDMIIEAGVREGDSTKAFAKAMSFSEARLIGLDIESCPDTAYAKLKNSQFMQMDDLQFPNYYQSVPSLKSHNLDIIFIDTSHYYDHTLAEISKFVPVLAKNGFLLFHDSYMSPLRNFQWYCIEGTTFGHGWDNQKGVTRAIKDYFSISFDETKYHNFSFVKNDTTWHLIHYPFCNGLTLIRKN